MQIRLYMDEDTMHSPVITGLRARGIDVASVTEEENEGLEDIDQLEYATAHNRVLCTGNSGDFLRLHTEYLRQGKTHAGIIIITQQRYGIGEQIRRLLRLIAAKSAEDMQNNIEFLSGW